MASSSVMVTAPGFCARVWAGGDGVCAGVVCAPAISKQGHTVSKSGRHRRRKRMGGQPSSAGQYKDGRAASGTKARRLLCGRGARRNVSRGVSYGGAEIERLRSGSCGQQDQGASAHRRRLDGLMAQMTNRAVVRRRSGVVMPDEAERSPYQERKERYRHYESRNCRLTRHVLSSVSRPCVRVGPV
jgi:hypothetical protein